MFVTLIVSGHLNLSRWFSHDTYLINAEIFYRINEHTGQSGNHIHQSYVMGTKAHHDYLEILNATSMGGSRMNSTNIGPQRLTSKDNWKESLGTSKSPLIWKINLNHSLHTVEADLQCQHLKTD